VALAAGARLGPYEIVSALGAGGMGEVYRAKDPRLGRDVAMKILPAAFSADPDRLRRFEQEARSAAALNHPNILTVHEIGTHAGQPYIVSELLEGQTLRDAFGHGGLPVKKVIEYAIQICHGLAAAHEKSIVHRDLKPENVFVTKDGRIKILDFGVAKLTDVAVLGAGATMMATRAETSPGLVIGTISYMSPEQVRGQTVDHRSDIFSFGSILYEALSGVRAFTGDTAADTLSAILGTDPPKLTIGRGSISSGLERIVRRCLEKLPGQRFQSATDVAFALETVTNTTEWAAPTAPAADRGVRWAAPFVLTATAIVAALIGAAAMWWTVRPDTPAQSDRVSLVELARLTHDAGFSDSPSWSPDGTLFAYSSNRSGNFEIYVRRVEGGQEINVTNDPADDVQPAFSPDGTAIAFVSTRSSRTSLIKTGFAFGPTGLNSRTYGGDIWVTPALGGRARRVAEDGNFPVWRPDGRTIAYVSGTESHRAILERPTEGGESKPLLSSSASTWEIMRLRYSPDGRWLTFENIDRKVLVLPGVGGTPQELLRGRSHTWDPTGQRVYYMNDGPAGGSRLFSADIQGHSGNVSATPSPVALVTGLLQDLAVSSDGRRVLASEIQESLNLARLPLAPGGGGPAGPEEELSTSGQVRDGFPSVSPDGRRILLASSRLGEETLWTVNLESRGWERIQMPQKECGTFQGSWTPDGRHVAATCYLPDGTFSVWLITLDGSATKELVSRKRALSPGTNACEFSPDGRSLLYSYVKDGFNQLFVLDVATSRERQLTTSRSDKYDGRWSPDGQWIVFPSNAGGSLQAWKLPAQGGEERKLTSGHERMRHLFYSPDGRWIYVQPSHRNIYRLPAEGGQLQRVTNFPESGLFLEEPTISPDGKFLAYCRSRGGSSLWLLTLGTMRAPSSDRAPRP
jgi:eukaryotic-like serine/threonine-protein kinase